jgi:hypothetical protein
MLRRGEATRSGVSDEKTNNQACTWSVCMLKLALGLNGFCPAMTRWAGQIDCLSKPPGQRLGGFFVVCKVAATLDATAKGNVARRGKGRSTDPHYAAIVGV